MKAITYKVENDKLDYNKRIIKGDWNGSGAEFSCEIKHSPEGGDGADYFKLEINGGQVESGKLEMHGSLEREELIETLKVILNEL
mgnify:FL=1